MEGKIQIQQWQKYNALDKKIVTASYDKSNKYPFCKPEKSTTLESLLNPKVSSVGIVPVRDTAQVDEMEVMIIGKSSLKLEKEDANEQDDSQENPTKIVQETDEAKVEKSKKGREKMPAIVASVGTAGHITFSDRKKPKPMPMTKLKGRLPAKPSLLIPAPPNSRMSKRTSSAHSIHSNKIKTAMDTEDQHSEAPPSSPTENREIKVTVSDVKHTTSARSVDEIIKTLRTSREGGENRSSSDIRIDELMKQVMYHSEEWSKKDEDEVETEKDFNLESAPKILTASDIEEDMDVSDTVSTLASQISAPAGIPDVAAILLRKSSETAQRAGGDSEYSGFSSPIAGAGDAEEYVDAAQALKDLHQTLDVRNEDILCVKGQHPPTVSYEPTSEDEGYFDSVSGSSSDRFHPPEISTTTVTTGGRIHHLCLLAANTATQFEISPSDAALSRLMHTADQYRSVLRPVHVTKKITTTLETSPPAPPPSQANQSVYEGYSCEEGSQYTQDTKLHSVLEEVEEYNNRGVIGLEEKQADKQIDETPSTELDTSKIDPLDFEAWKKLAEGTIEHVDFTQQGEKCTGRESNIWRLIWNPAPPKMMIPPVAVKAALFPHYHGTQISAGTTDGELEELQMDELESDEEDEKEQKKSDINLLYLYRKHKSEEDLPSLIKRETQMSEIHRPPSIPDLSSSHTPDLKFVKMKADYSTAMEELRLQRKVALEQEQTAAPAVTPITPTGVVTIQVESRISGQVLHKKSVKIEESSEPITLEPKLSLAELSRQGGQDYVSQRRKSRRKSIKKDSVIMREVRRQLASYDPIPLRRSRSVETGLPDNLTMYVDPRKESSSHRAVKQRVRKRHRSLPRELEFQEFIDCQENQLEDIEEMREWVRGIWNGWFDEIYPPSESDDESWSTSSSELEESEMLDDISSKPGMTSIPRPSSASAAKQKVPTKIPDVLPPVVVVIIGEEEDELADEESTIEMMQVEVDALSKRISSLLPTETATLAILISRRGALRRKLGEIKSAKKDLNQAISLEPRLATAYWHRHLIRLLENQLHEALDDLNILLKLDKGHVHAYRSRADIFATLGDFTMAIVNYSQAIKLNPNDEEAYFQRAQLYEKKGDMLLALEDYGSVVRINPFRTDALLKRGRFNFSQGNWHSTIADFTHMIQKEPHNALARTYRGRAYAAMKQYESALADLSASIHLDPLNWRAFYHRGCLLRTIAPEKSLQDFSSSLLINDSYENAMALLHRGILYTELKRFPEAVVDFEECLRLDHGLACAHVNIGLVHHQITRNYWEAIRNFTNAIKVDPTYTRAYMCRSDAYEKIGEHKKALHDVTRAIVLRPDDRHLYLRRGQLLLQLGQLELAGFCVRHIATLGEGIVSTSATQQAVVQSFLKNHDRAVDSLTAACRVKPVPHMYVLLGKTLMKAKRFKQAISNFKNALDLLNANITFPTSTSFNTGQDQLNPEEAAEIHFLLGQCYTQLEQHTSALYSYNHALKANPDYALAYYRRGLCRLKMDHSKGVQDLNRALALDPTLFEAFLSRAAFYGIKKRYSKAILNCNEALRLRPRSVRALLYRGALKFYIRAYMLAVHDLTAAIKLERQCALAYFNRAVCYQRMKKYNEALKDYSVVLMLEDEMQAPKEKEIAGSMRLRVYVNRGLLYLRDLDDAHNAALDFESVTKMQPKNIRVLHTMALCYHKLKLLKEAVNSYSLCLAVDPYFLAGYIGRGDAHADANDVVASRRDYQRALKLDPTCVSARINLGYSLQSIGKLHQAWLQFTRAIELDPSSQQALEGRAVTCLRAGNVEAAFQDVSSAFRAGPASARLHATRGVIHQYMGDFYSAMADYQRAIKLDDMYSAAFFNAAALYLQDRRFREALAYLDRAVTLAPEDDAALLNRGIARVLLNDTERALEDFDNAIKINAKNAHSFFNRGNLLTMMKKYKEAELDYTSAFSVDPSDYGALKKRADVRGKLGNKDAAISDYRRALEMYERKKFLAGAA